MSSQPYIGNIMLFCGNFAPRGWSFCNGTLLAIANYNALFALLGTTYGGDGVTTFGLPDLRGRFPLHMGQGPGLPNYTIGQSSGSEGVTLSVTELPQHTHSARASSIGNSDDPTNRVWANSTATKLYAAVPGTINMNAGSTSTAGSSLPHENMHPFLVFNFVIATEGIFPSPN